MTTTSPVLEADDLVRRFGPVTAVDHVSLRIEPGQTFGLLGPNGAGKTTLLQVAAAQLHEAMAKRFPVRAGMRGRGPAAGAAGRPQASSRRGTKRSVARPFPRCHGLSGLDSAASGEDRQPPEGQRESWLRRLIPG